MRLERTSYENETVVITASRTQEALSEVSVPVLVVPKQEIQQSGNIRLMIYCQNNWDCTWLKTMALGYKCRGLTQNTPSSL